MLGSTVVLNPTALSGGDVYVEVSVDGTTLSGRQRLGSTPYSLRSNVASSAEAVEWGNVGSIPSGFADGTDNAGVTSVTTSGWLSGGGSGGGVNVAFAATVTDYTVTIPRTENFNAIARRNMTPLATSFCYLTLIQFGDDNDEDDTSQCSIRRDAGAGVWQLQGRTNSNETQGYCWASCVSW